MSIGSISALFLLAVCTALLGTWFGLTFFFQFIPPSERWIDIYQIIPKWTFFAPRPGRVDFRIVFQDFTLEEKPTSPPQELPIHVRRSPLHALWNPNKRVRKAILDIAQVIQLKPGQAEKPEVQLAVPYLILLNLVDAYDPGINAHYRRFVIVATAGFDGEVEPQIIFSSFLHPFREMGKWTDV
jgi:hypothetical protein